MVEWLSSVSKLPVRLAHPGACVEPGVIQLLPSESHAAVVAGGHLVLRSVGENDIYRPSCDRLLESVAKIYGARSIGLILSGMGRDGVKGMERISEAGGTTIAQDEASSVVFGMNRVAIEQGWVKQVLPLDAIAAEMIRLSGIER
jgi:two-component system chemotaxis response regulator CheB